MSDAATMLPFAACPGIRWCGRPVTQRTRFDVSDHTQQPIYQDRITGENFQDARTMLTRYLAKFCAKMKLPVIELDGAGHADVNRGSATIGINVLEAQGVLMIFAPVMDVPVTGREAFYRTLLDMSFVATQDAAFAIDGPRDKVVLRVLRRLSALDYEEFDDLLITVGQVADDFDDRLIAEYGT